MHQESNAHQRSETSEEQRELRECRSCYGTGAVVEDASYSAETGELVQAVVTCPACKGAKVISVYVYAGRR
jgi:DnaJ-class molecular chaperone